MKTETPRPSNRSKRLALISAVAVAAAALYVLGSWREARLDEDTARIQGVLKLGPGMTIAEIGAGNGRRTLLLARRLGSKSRLYVTELGERRSEKLRAAVEAAGLGNVIVIEGSPDEAKLPRGCCDAIFMNNVYHHFTEPEAMNASLFEALRPGGLLAVLDFPPNRWMFWMPRPHGVSEGRGGHGMPMGLLIGEVTRAGFRLVEAIEVWQVWPVRRYCVVFKKPAEAGNINGQGMTRLLVHGGKVHNARLLRQLHDLGFAVPVADPG